ncbi:MAG: plastocyanin/azurin family copper-binding protein [Haloarculaceae archaeon]
MSTPDHTVTTYHPVHGFQRRIPENAVPFSSPTVAVGGAWLYRFDEPGVYDVYCGPHHAFGMAGRVVVGDGSGEPPGYVDDFSVPDDAEIPAPYSRQMLEGELNEFSRRNGDAEWVWLTPQEVLGTDALDPDRVRQAGSVSFQRVRREIEGSGGGHDAGSDDAGTDHESDGNGSDDHRG